MALTLTASGAGRLGAPTSTTKALTTTPMPTSATTAGATAAPKATGPYDKFRAAKPADIPDAWWNSYIDSQNTAYAQIKAKDPNWNEAKAQAEFNRITPEAFVQSARTNGAPGSDYSKTIAGASNVAPPGTIQEAAATEKKDSYTDRILGLAEQSYNDSRGFADQNLSPLLNQQQVAVNRAGALDKDALAQLTAAGQTASATQQRALADQAANASKYNAQGTAQFDAYKAQQDALSGQDQGTLASYLQATDPLMTQLTAHGSDPNDVAAQQAALQRAIGIAGGSLNYNAAQASSNAADVARQQQGYGDLQGIGQGRLDYQSQAARAFADPTDVANQRKALADIQGEVATGGAEQQAALDTIKSRTGVAPTAEEALLYELNRRSRESQDASSRGAVMDRMAARGLRSGGAELASMQQAGQQTAQDRLLADMAANAGAVKRAQSYTGMQADLATAMRGNQQNALGLQGNMSTALRNAGFDEAYKRGVGADTASANNQGTRLSGSLGAANTANIMRGQSDTMSMFNTGQTNQASANNQQTQLGGAQLQGAQSNAIRSANDTISMFKDSFASQEAGRVGELAGQRATQGLATTGQVGDRNESTYKSGEGVLDTNYSRDRDTTEDLTASIDPEFDRSKTVTDAMVDTGQRGVNRVTGQIGSGALVAGARQGASSPQQLIDALKYATGGIVQDEDTHALGGR